MRKFVWGIAVAGALALPATASATHIPGATYTGTFTTGTPGAAVEVVVSADGTVVDFDSAGWGNNGDCPSNSIGPDDLAISNEGFSFFDAGPPFVSLSGFFGDPGVVSGTAQISGVCNSGSQSWSATTPVAWPDAVISAGGKTKGQGVYDEDGGPKQTLKRSAKKGKSARFKVIVENDGTIGGLFNVKGCKAKAATYRSGGENITGEVKSATGYEPEIAAGEDIAVQLKYSAKRGKVGSTKKCAVKANSDTVVAVTKITRN